MNRKEKQEERQHLLSEFADELQKQLIPAVYSKAEDGNGLEEVAVMFNDLGEGDEEAFGEFFFRPFETEEDEVQFFMGMITISDDLPEESLPQLYEGISYLNFHLTCGSFAIDTSHSYLCYRLCVPFDADVTAEEVYTQMNIVFMNALSNTDMYMGVLLGIAAGTDTLADLKELLGVVE